MHKALALPDILLHIGDHIRDKDLASCARVCRAWHASLRRFLFRSVVLSIHNKNQATTPPFALKALQRNLRSLQFQFSYPIQFLKLQDCHRLSHLRIDINPLYLRVYDNDSANMPRALLRGLIPELYDTMEDPPKHVFKYLRALVIHHAATLTCLTLTCDLDLNKASFWRAVGTSPHLVRVELFLVMIHSSALMAFLNACANIKYLTMFHTTLNIDGPMPEIESDMPTFRRLEELNWQPVFGEFEERLLVMLEHMPVLKSLAWGKEGIRRGNESLVQRINHVLTTGKMPFLQKLYLPDQSWTDGQLSELVGKMRQLEGLLVQGTRFGSSTFTMLQETGFIHSLRKIGLRKCFEVSSRMVQQIMETCVHLEDLDAERIESNDILQGEPWVCMGLQRIKLDFVIHEVFTEGQVMKDRTLVSDNMRPVQLLLLTRLAELTRLEYIVFTYTEPTMPREYMMDLRCNTGLQLLGTWTRLKHFGVAELQRMKAVEIEWMLKTWPQLEEVSGNLHTDPSRNRDLFKLLAKRGIFEEHLLVRTKGWGH
ncbi:hypothetical protein CPB97_005333 [Podila verticillata]|nr:hypothetical protein CPB97_005333 [Podila verticillata]